PTFGDDMRQGRCYYRGLLAHRAGMINQKARNRVAQLGLASCRFYAIDELGLGRLRYRTPLRYRPFKVRDGVAKGHTFRAPDQLRQAFGPHLEIEPSGEYAIPARR